MLFFESQITRITQISFLCNRCLSYLVIKNDNSGYTLRVTSLSQTLVDCMYNINLAGGIEDYLLPKKKYYCQKRYVKRLFVVFVKAYVTALLTL